MKLSELTSMLEEIGVPVAYRAFEESENAPAPPFICYLFPNNDPESADNINYAKIEELDIELYTSYKDFELEELVETVLAEHGFSFYREETFLSDEKVYMTTYTMEVLINATE